MRRRFFVERFEAGKATLDGERATHLSRVLRAQPGQIYELSDGVQLWLARVEAAHRDAVNFTLLEQVPASAPALAITLLLSITKFDRLEWCLEKATELGVSRIIPLAAARSEKGLVRAASKRAERWRKILCESAQQSRRLRPPELRDTQKPAQAMAETKAGLRMLCSELTGARPLRDALETPEGKTSGVVLAFGPEGGWTDAELVSAEDSGFLPVSLGEGILRSETAVIAAMAMVQYALGGIGSLP